MPLSTRDWAKREIDAACGNIDWVFNHLSKVIEVYAKDHPEIAAPLAKAVEGQLIVKEVLQQLKESF